MILSGILHLLLQLMKFFPHHYNHFSSSCLYLSIDFLMLHTYKISVCFTCWKGRFLGSKSRDVIQLILGEFRNVSLLFQRRWIKYQTLRNASTYSSTSSIYRTLRHQKVLSQKMPTAWIFSGHAASKYLL